MSEPSVFVTVGAQMPFDRMVGIVNRWASEHPDADVLAQIGDSESPPSSVPSERILSPQEFDKRFAEADVVVAHAGTGTVLKALDQQTPIIVMARRASLGEHRNEHQLATVELLRGRRGIYIAENEDELTCLLDRAVELEAPDLPEGQADASLIDAIAGFIDADADAGHSESVVAFAAVDWWYHNRGHSECQVMRRLADDVPVLWINSIGMRAPTKAKTEIPLRRYVRKLKSTLKGLRKDSSGMWVLSPIFIPAYSPRMIKVNGWLLRAQIALVRRVLRMSHPAAFVTLPTAADAALGSSYERVVYNRSDKHSEFPEADQALIAAVETRLMAESDEVLYVSDSLMTQEHGVYRRARNIGHGVDYDHFADAANRRFSDDPPPIPAELADLPRPLIGFYGALDDYLLDVDLFVATARAHPDSSVVIIGPQAMEIDALEAEPNIHYLGPVPYEELPGYAAQFDVGIMPWLRNEWVERSNPIKLKEYLALGFPIASIGFPELEPYRELAHVADDEASFLAAVDAALAEGTDGRSARQASVADSSWEAVTAQVATSLGV